MLVGINDSGQPLVRHPLDPAAQIMLARTTVPIDAGQVDREVVIAFEFGDLGKPIVLGVLSRTLTEDQSELRPLAARSSDSLSSRQPSMASNWCSPPKVRSS